MSQDDDSVRPKPRRLRVPVDDVPRPSTAFGTGATQPASVEVTLDEPVTAITPQRAQLAAPPAPGEVSRRSFPPPVPPAAPPLAIPPPSIVTTPSIVPVSDAGRNTLIDPFDAESTVEFALTHEDLPLELTRDTPVPTEPELPALIVDEPARLAPAPTPSRPSSVPPGSVPRGLWDRPDDPPSSEQTLDSATPRPPSVIRSTVIVVNRSVAPTTAPAPVVPPDATTPGGYMAPPPEPTSAEVELTYDDGPSYEQAPRGPAEGDGELEADEALLEEADVAPEPIAVARPPAPPPAPPVAPPTPPRPPEERASTPSKPPAKRKAAWWEDMFSDDYLRTVPVPHPRWIEKQCDFIAERLGLPAGAVILDLGCGLGLHAIELTRRGYTVVGLDFSLPMLSRAADEAQDQGFTINFLHGDMREMSFENAFDAVLVWGTTLGYFDDDTNRAVIERVYRALKPGGLFLLDVVNRDYAQRGQPNLVWFQGDGCIVMEETSFQPLTSRLIVKRNVMLDDGRQRETHYSLRLYACHELGQVLHQRGFRVVEVSGREAMPGVFFGAESPRIILLAERRVQAPKSGESETPREPDQAQKS